MPTESPKKPRLLPACGPLLISALIGLLLAEAAFASEVEFGRCDGQQQQLSFREAGPSGEPSVARIGLRKTGAEPAIVFYQTEPISAQVGLDFADHSGSLFLGELAEFCGSVEVPILDDGEAEGDEQFRLRIVVSPDFGGRLSGPDSLVITIQDDDGPPTDLGVDKTDDGFIWSKDDPLVRYRIPVTDEQSRRIELRETVPVNTTFLPGESDPAWRCVPGPGENSECFLEVDARPRSGAPTELSFSVRVNDEAPSGFEIFNEVEATPTAEVGASGREEEAAWLSQAATVASVQGFDTTLNVAKDFALLCACIIGLADDVACGGTSAPAGSAVTTAWQRIGSPGTRAMDPVALFRLRDRVLRNTAGGRRAVQLFYDHGIDLARAAFDTPGYFDKFHGVLRDWMPIFEALVDGRGDAVTLTPSQVQGMKDFFDDLRPVASPRLLAAINAQVARLDLDTVPGLDGNQMLARLNQLGCEAGDHVLCLNEGRFRVEVEWQDFEGNTGKGRVRPMTDDTGSFWFFDQENLELVVKVLDGRAINDRFWVFYGALSNVEYTLNVTDTATGFARSYRNPAHRFASVGDTDAFDPEALPSTAGAVPSPAPGPPTSWRSGPWNHALSAARSSAEVGAQSAPGAVGSCTPSATVLCLNEGRFRVEVEWQDFESNTGDGQAVATTDDTGTFWFFNRENVELIVKLLDGRSINGRFWVFYGALSNVSYVVTVTDTATGAVKRYENPAGRFGSAGDTDAF